MCARSQVLKRERASERAHRDSSRAFQVPSFGSAREVVKRCARARTRTKCDRPSARRRRRLSHDTDSAPPLGRRTAAVAPVTCSSRLFVRLHATLRRQRRRYEDRNYPLALRAARRGGPFRQYRTHSQVGGEFVTVETIASRSPGALVLHASILKRCARIQAPARKK